MAFLKTLSIKSSSHFYSKANSTGNWLGLSLSYDIIKAHGGEIKVESREGEGSKFFIQLPNMTLQ